MAHPETSILSPLSLQKHTLSILHSCTLLAFALLGFSVGAPQQPLPLLPCRIRTFGPAGSFLGSYPFSPFSLATTPRCPSPQLGTLADPRRGGGLIRQPRWRDQPPGPPSSGGGVDSPAPLATPTTRPRLAPNPRPWGTLNKGGGTRNGQPSRFWNKCGDPFPAHLVRPLRGRTWVPT